MVRRVWDWLIEPVPTARLWPYLALGFALREVLRWL